MSLMNDQESLVAITKFTPNTILDNFFKIVVGGKLCERSLLKFSNIASICSPISSLAVRSLAVSKVTTGSRKMFHPLTTVCTMFSSVM